jgi:hypothetical protein
LLPASIPAQACDGVDCPSASNALQQTNAGNDASKSAKGGADTADTAGTDQEAADARAAARAAAEAAGKNEEVAPEGQNVQTRTLKEIFGEDVAAHGDFEKAVTEAYKDPLLRPQQKTTTWERRDRKDKKEPEQDEDDIDLSALKWLSGVVGFIVENVLWLLLGALVLALALTAKRWWPWLAGIAAEPEPEPEPVEMMHLAHAEPLPPDIATVARRLWAEGQPRRALALLYRASVEAMTARLDAHPPPGATEADYLRLSRRLPDTEDRDAFRGMVRIWQYAAYGQRLPGADEFETLVQTLAQRFRWAA